MNRHLSKIINRIAPRKPVRSDVPDPDQLSLFAGLDSPPQSSHNVQPIRLPRSVLVLNPDEQLSQYLSRVAATAMLAATRTCGSPAKAALRLGTSVDLLDQEDHQEHQRQFPALRLVSINSQRFCKLN
jgi:hypothetical protein